MLTEARRRRLDPRRTTTPACSSHQRGGSRGARWRAREVAPSTASSRGGRAGSRGRWERPLSTRGRAQTRQGKASCSPPSTASSRGGRAGVPRAGVVAAVLASSIRWRVSLLLLHRAGRGSRGRVSLFLLHRARELDSLLPCSQARFPKQTEGSGLTTRVEEAIVPPAWALLAMRALLHTCRLVLDVLGIWILVKLDWSRLDACTNN
jgi:hypothetical protein